jgi:hypothetical protein
MGVILGPPSLTACLCVLPGSLCLLLSYRGAPGFWGSHRDTSGMCLQLAQDDSHGPPAPSLPLQKAWCCQFTEYRSVPKLSLQPVPRLSGGKSPEKPRPATPNVGTMGSTCGLFSFK